MTGARGATYTVDASVFVNAFHPQEPHHEFSLRLLNWLRNGGASLIEPTLLLPEVAATIARAKGDAALAHRFAGALGRLPRLRLVPLDDIYTMNAVIFAAEFRLRGSDSVYASVAGHYGSTLVTLDREHLERLPRTLPVRRPSEVLSEIVRGVPRSPPTSPTPS